MSGAKAFEALLNFKGGDFGIFRKSVFDSYYAQSIKNPTFAFLITQRCTHTSFKKECVTVRPIKWAICIMAIMLSIMRSAG